MNINIVELNNNVVNKIDIDEKISFTSEQLSENNIIDIKDAHIVGYITKNSSEEYILTARIYGTMVLPCSVSLKPTNYDFDISIDDNIADLLEELGKTLKNNENTIDIFPIIWENILMEIPMRIVNEDISDIELKGDGWRVISDESEFQSDESVNPELEKLKDLLK